MWNSCAKFNRLKKALRYRGLDPDNLNLDELSRVLKKRGITDARQNPMIWELIKTLEPPGCDMNHCENYGNSPCFCNCRKELVPSKCKIYKEYKKRRKEKEQKRIEKIMASLQQAADFFRGIDNDGIPLPMLREKVNEIDANMAKVPSVSLNGRIEDFFTYIGMRDKQPLFKVKEPQPCLTA